MIRFVCTCGRQLQAREENAGKVVLCPACKQRVTVPNQDSTSIQPEEPGEPAPSPQQRVQREQPAPPDENEMESEAEDRPRRPASGDRSGKALASLILGIVSFCGCVCFTGLPAIVLGILSLLDIGRAAGLMTGKPMAIIGIVLGSLGTFCTPIGLYFGLWFPAVSKVRDAANRQQSIGNLKQIGLGMHNYNDVNDGLPPAGIGDPGKPPARRKPLLSWRVAILPYVEQQQLYSQFKLDEPWDGPNNIKLLAKMPKIYMLPGDEKTKPDHTHYQVFVGNGAAFDKTKGYPIAGGFPDGLSRTILIVEAENAVPWTKPEDVPFDPSKPVLPLMSRHFGSVFHVALADGSVRPVVPQISEKTFKAAITRSGGETLGSDRVEKRTTGSHAPRCRPPPLSFASRNTQARGCRCHRRRGRTDAGVVIDLAGQRLGLVGRVGLGDLVGGDGRRWRRLYHPHRRRLVRFLLHMRSRAEASRPRQGQHQQPTSPSHHGHFSPMLVPSRIACSR